MEVVPIDDNDERVVNPPATDAVVTDDDNVLTMCNRVHAPMVVMTMTNRKSTPLLQMQW